AEGLDKGRNGILGLRSNTLQKNIGYTLNIFVRVFDCLEEHRDRGLGFRADAFQRLDGRQADAPNSLLKAFHAPGHGRLRFDTVARSSPQTYRLRAALAAVSAYWSFTAPIKPGTPGLASAPKLISMLKASRRM